MIIGTIMAVFMLVVARHYSTIYRGIGAYSPECLFIVQFGASWNIF